MKAPKRLLVPALVATLAACATLLPERPPEQNAQLRLDRGLSALQAGLFTEGFDDLAWVYSHCAGRQAGSHALAALAGIELDPRNRLARPALGTELLGKLIQDPAAPDWVRPLAESAFLAGLALGAPHPGGDTAAAMDHEDHEEDHDVGVAEGLDAEPHAEPETAADRRPLHDPVGATGMVFGCGPAVDAEGWAPPALPALTGPSMAELLANAHQKREVAVSRADTLQKELATVREELQTTRAELERIRETLKP